jgi:Protein of unknown function (DUF2628)
MAVYTVHEPPLRAGAASAEVERFVFVRDGFSWWAFLFAPLWMLWHRMWLVLIGYIVVVGGAKVLALLAGAPNFAVSLIGILLGLLVGLEASTLRRFTLRRRRWRNVGVVSGRNIEEAERRFFDAWLKWPNAPPAPPTARAPSPPPLPPAPAPAPRAPSSPSGVIGLFPEPGAGR